MNRQNLLLVLFSAILLPLVWWNASTLQKAREAQLAEWRKHRLEWYEWIAKHPEEIQKHPGWYFQLKAPRNADWVHAHPPVEAAIAAITSMDIAAIKSNVNAAATPAAPANKTPETAEPPRRREFLDKLGAQKPGEIPFTTKTLTLALSTTGGSVDTLKFNELKESSFKPVAQTDPPVNDLGPLELLKVWDPAERSFALTSKAANEALDAVEWLHEEIPGGHRFSRILPGGELLVTKEYLLPEATNGPYQDYHVTLRVSVENLGDAVQQFHYALMGPAGLVEQPTMRPLPVEAAIGRRDEQGGFTVEKRSAKDIFSDVKDNKGTLKVQAPGANRIAFYGIIEKHFGCVVIPQDDRLPIEAASADTLLHLLGKTPGPTDEKAFATQEPTIVKEVAVTGTRSSFSVSPHARVSQDYIIFAGPLWREMLDSHPVYSKADMGELVNYTSIIPGVKWLAILLTKILLGFHWLTRSWGLSIVLLTILVRAALHPLMVRQTKSTQKMQSLGPEINKIKEKYQDKDGNMSPEDTKKFQAEQMDLWKKHGINPLGCMGPMLLQLPIFYGLWNALQYAFELRHSSFLWIRDLTEPDVVARLPFSLPMHGTNAFCILPIVMLVVYIFQMKSMPKSQDPQQAEQAKMMQWMMPIFGYMFYSIQSGLLLYYITSSALGMLEQRWIKKRLGIVAPPVGVPAKV
jgi:YidC/Oxa1 family membrane protein insertase